MRECLRTTESSRSSTQVQKLKKQRKIKENTTFLKSHKMSLYRQLMVASSILVTSSKENSSIVSIGEFLFYNTEVEKLQRICYTKIKEIFSEKV